MGATLPPSSRKPAHAYEVEWTTISYRTIAAYVFLVLLGIGIVLYFIMPNYFGQKVRQLLAAVSAGMVRSNETDSQTLRREAHFVNIDGTVRCKKAQSLQWVRADYNTNLEKGDFVQTAGDGRARIMFADGTLYTLKEDSLIVIEENREDQVTHKTQSSIQVPSGTVEAYTGKLEPGSTVQVSFERVVASLREETRAVVHSDPAKKTYDVTVNQGSATVRRDQTQLRIVADERASVDARERGLTKRTVISPPKLTQPPYLDLKVAKDLKNTSIEFAWTEVPGAVAYHLQVSPSASLSPLVVDRKLASRTSTQVPGLEEGTYYWTVSSIDAKGVESQASAPNRFHLLQEAEAGTNILLKIDKIVQHGPVVEVVGKTEPGSTVIINNEQVFSIAPDGTFHHFTSPLPKSGLNQVTITAQNSRGDTKTIRTSVVIE